MYCTDKDHTVQKYTDKKETVTEPDMWEGYNVTLHYSKAIDCTESDMMKELNKEDRLLIIEAIREYLETLEEWEDTNEEYIKELNNLLERL